MLPGCLHAKENKFSKANIAKSNKIGLWEAGSIVKNIIKVSYHSGNFNIILYRENVKGATP